MVSLSTSSISTNMSIALSLCSESNKLIPATYFLENSSCSRRCSCRTLFRPINQPYAAATGSRRNSNSSIVIYQTSRAEKALYAYAGNVFAYLNDWQEKRTNQIKIQYLTSTQVMLTVLALVLL